MPSKIDHNLIPPVIRDSVDPDILNRAQSIEWSINRDTGEDEHGFLDGSAEDYLSSQNLLPKSHGAAHFGQSPICGGGQARKSRKMVEWSDTISGRDSGLEASPASPALRNSSAGRVDLSPLDESAALVESFGADRAPNTTGSMKRHPQGLHPYPIYKVNQDQLQGDVFFEVAPRAAPGERTVHYEKASRVLNQEEMDALGLDPSVFGPNSRTTMDEQEEETIETSVLKGGARELNAIYNSMRNDAGDYFERQRARSLSPAGGRPSEEYSSEQKKTILFGSVDEINNQDQEYYPYRDAHQGKVSAVEVLLLFSRRCSCLCSSKLANNPFRLAAPPLAASWRQRIRHLGKQVRRQAPVEALQRPVGSRRRTQEACGTEVREVHGREDQM